MNFGRWNSGDRNLLQWDERHREFSEVWDETLKILGVKAATKSIEVKVND